MLNRWWQRATRSLLGPATARVVTVVACVAVAAQIGGTTRPVASSADTCVGDCSSNGSVTIDEILVLVTIALGGANTDACQAGDRNLDGRVTIDEILAAVNAALNSCPVPSPTPVGLDVSGHWAGSVTSNDGFEETLAFDLMQSGAEVTGAYVTEFFEEGTITAHVDGNRLTPFTLDETTVGCTGRFTGIATVTGDFMMFSYQGFDCEGSFSATGSAQRVILCTASGQSDCCGNSVKEAREECDGADTATCQDLGFEGGHTTCADCRLDRSNCFTGGECAVGGACDEECFVLCPDGSFSQACSNGVCVLGSCACTEDFVECCQLAGVPLP